MTADNDSDAADPFSSTFRTAPAGRAPFRFTSFGDLATPNTADPVNPASGTKGAPTPDYTEFETFTLVRPR